MLLNLLSKELLRNWLRMKIRELLVFQGGKSETKQNKQEHWQSKKIMRQSKTESLNKLAKSMISKYDDYKKHLEKN